VIVVGEELTVFEFVRGKSETTLRTTGLDFASWSDFKAFVDCKQFFTLGVLHQHMNK